LFLAKLRFDELLEELSAILSKFARIGLDLAILANEKFVTYGSNKSGVMTNEHDAAFEFVKRLDESVDCLVGGLIVPLVAPNTLLLHSGIGLPRDPSDWKVHRIVKCGA